MTRNKILSLLTETDGYLSGQQMSDRLGLTRAAVWKGIQSLRAEGFLIEAKTNCGYRLIESPDVLTAEMVSAHLARHAASGGGAAPLLGGELIYLPAVDSTNAYLKQLAAQGAAEGTVVLADTQTAGRGRLGRSFFSPPGRSVYLSVLLRPKEAPAALTGLTAFSAVAVCEALEAAAKVSPRIKWVNDILLSEKKVCGILTELSVESESGRVESVVIGAGVNVLQQPGDFPDEIQGRATSLFAETGEAVSRAALAAALICALDRMYRGCQADPRPWRDGYEARCINLGRAVRVMRDGREKNARAVALDDNCGLIVEYENGGRETLQYGQVSLRGESGYV